MDDKRNSFIFYFLTGGEQDTEGGMQFRRSSTQRKKEQNYDILNLIRRKIKEGKKN